MILQCYITPHNRVKYITNQMTEPATIKYEDFIEYINMNFVLEDKGGFLNDFNVVGLLFTLNNETHQWKRSYFESNREVSYEDLLKINQQKEANNKTLKDIFENAYRGLK